MREFLLRTLLYTIFNITVFLLSGACVQPVNVDSFLDDDKIQDIIRGGNDTISVELEELERGQPILLQDGSLINKGAMVTLYYPGSGMPESSNISIANYNDYTAITWFNSNTNTPLGSGASVTVTASVPPFDKVGDHLLTVHVVDKENAPRTSFVIVRIVLN